MNQLQGIGAETDESMDEIAPRFQPRKPVLDLLHQRLRDFFFLGDDPIRRKGAEKIDVLVFMQHELELRGNLHLYFQEGKGHAVRAGFAQATGEVMLIQDADLEYDLSDYDILLAPIAAGRQAFVLGSRHGEGGWAIRKFSDQPSALQDPIVKTLGAAHLVGSMLAFALASAKFV